MSAQTVVSNHPPLSPAEAVAVLRGSHSPADLTDYRGRADGPTIVVMGSSVTPWDWPPGASEPPRPLAADYLLFAPRYEPHYGSRFGETTFYVGQRDHNRGVTAHRPAPTTVEATPTRSIAATHLRAEGASGGVVRPR